MNLGLRPASWGGKEFEDLEPEALATRQRPDPCPGAGEHGITATTRRTAGHGLTGEAQIPKPPGRAGGREEEESGEVHGG